VTGRVAWIAIAPVKGLALVEREAVEVTRRGIEGDRDFFVVDEHDRMISATRIGVLLQVAVEHDREAGTLVLRFPDGASVGGEIGLGSEEKVDFFGLDMPARPVLGEYSEALSAHAGQPLRLLAAPPLRGGTDRGVHGAVTLLSTASLERLRAEAGAAQPVDPRRFRMTFGIDGLEPHEEDGWVAREVQAGDAVLRVTGHVGRCVLTTRNADSGTVDFPTLKLLAAYRGKEEATEPLPFGVHASVTAGGTVTVGDPVLPL
jgi:uncharacterized protein YcbX